VIGGVISRVMAAQVAIRDCPGDRVAVIPEATAPIAAPAIIVGTQ
jgi:hypothetical protein